MVEQTGQPLDVIERAVERDKFMTAEEAKTFGLIDLVVTTRDPPEKDKETRPHLAA
jgi:ATP-dependent Clp protease protease subunit